MSVDEPVALCPHGHPNRLGSAFCSTCGQRLGPMQGAAVGGAAPSSTAAPTGPIPPDGERPWYVGAVAESSEHFVAPPVSHPNATPGVAAGSVAPVPPIGTSAPQPPPFQPTPEPPGPPQAGYGPQAGYPPQVGLAPQVGFPTANGAHGGRSSTSGLARVVTVVGALAAVAGPFVIMVLIAYTIGAFAFHLGIPSVSRIWAWVLPGPTDWYLTLIGTLTVRVLLEPFGAIGLLLAIVAGILAVVGARSGAAVSLVSGGVLLLLAGSTAIRAIVKLGSGIEVLWSGPWQGWYATMLTIDFVVPGLLLVVGGIVGLLSQRSRAPYGSLV